MEERRTAVISVSLPLWATALVGLAERSDLEVVGSAHDPERALRLIAEKRPDVFIAEIESFNGALDLELVREARRVAPELRVIVISSERDREAVAAAIASGVDVYVLHDADPEDLSSGMRQLFDQSIFIAANWAAPPALQSMRNSAPALTRREFEILQLAAHGHTNSAMAQMLTVTEQTIKFHLSNVYRKLNVSNRTEASRWAQVHGLLPLRAVELDEDSASVA
jgi:DNA-binding NarL/FixJ family response regulator